MAGTDPLLRALADGDPACPDGAALTRLGRLVRAQVPVAQTDLRSRLHQRLAFVTPISSDEEGATIDAHYQGHTSDTHLARLDALTALPLPRPVDLRAKVRARITGTARLTVIDPAAAQRRRLISLVVVAHLAAALVFAVIRFGTSGDLLAPVAEHTTMGAPGVTTLPTDLPARWSDLRQSHGDLYRLRRSADLRAAARQAWGTARSAGDVGAALRWLVLQTGTDGRIGPAIDDPDRAAATQGLAILALLGEGFGDSARVAAARHACTWLATQGTPRSTAAQGIATLALVEGGLLLSDPGLCAVANARLADTAPLAAQGAFTLLAVESAWQGGLDVPPRLLEQTRRTLARTLPAADDHDLAKLGLAALGRTINGHLGASTIGLAGRLAEAAPTVDATGTTDPLAWLPATLALRDLGGAAWTTWAERLQNATEPTFTRAGGLAWVEATRVRHAHAAGGEVFATAATVLNLQAAYRYLPVATTR
jgi:hypothetical protein